MLSVKAIRQEKEKILEMLNMSMQGSKKIKELVN
jgi:hypothetical protein